MQADLATLQGSGQIDPYRDIFPPAAANSSYIESCLMALKSNGKVSLMSGITEHIKIPHMVVMLHSIELRGRFMYKRGNVQSLINLYEQGLLRIGHAAGYKSSIKFRLEDC